MMKKRTLDKLFKSDDWKTEKHAPVIEVEGSVLKNAFFTVKVSVGREVEHPNSVEHHIRWIQLYFLPEGQEIPVHVGTYDFASHGENGEADEGIFAHPCIATSMRIDRGGRLLASSYCNIHGLWQTAREIEVEE
jgi:superoxide reductase